MVNIHEIWENDIDKVFLFSSVEQYFRNSTPQEAFDALSIRYIRNFNGLKVVHDESQPFFVTREGKAFTLDGNNHHDFTLYENFQYLVCPVYYDSSYDEVDFSSYRLEEIFKPKWAESAEPLTSVAIGETDFYERYGWWPHVETTNSKLGFMPMSHIADVMVEGKIVSIFDDLDYSVIPYEEFEGARITEDFKKREANPVVIFGDGSQTPSYIQKREISPELVEKIAHKKDGYEQFSHKLVPAESLYEGLAGCQDDYTPPAPFNKVLYHIPAPWHGMEATSEESLWRVNSGDCGSFLLTWDGAWNFNLMYQQT